MLKAIIALLLLSVSLGTAAQGANDSAKLDQLRKAVQAKLPPRVGDIESITKTNYLGLYEVYAGGDIFYTDENATYLFLGDIIEAKSLSNLTEERRRKLASIKFDSLPLNLAIKTVRGNGKRKVAVFSDPDCPYCKRLEKEMVNVNDVTIYTFLYPIESLHPNAPEKSKNVWCAADRAKVWYDFMLRNVPVPSTAECDNPIAKIAEVGQKHRIRATPTLVFADGRVVPGALPNSEIENYLNAGEKK